MDKPPAAPPATDRDRAALQARLVRLAERRTPDDPAVASPATTRRWARRPHPARRARIAAFGLTVASTSGLTVHFLRAPTNTQAAPASIIVASEVTIPRTPIATPTSDAGKGVDLSLAAEGAVVDGAVFRNRWGTVQVRATFDASGALVAVDAIQVPGDSPPSVFINDNALPVLDAEALQLQSARVHTVTGATDTSDGYQQSLQAAIDAARAAQLTTLG